MKTEKILYVSDLDGTLFNSEKCISEKSTEIIRKCINEGMLFSIATARMPYGCDYRLEKLNLSVPGLLTNGVFLYDFSERRYIDVELVDVLAAVQVIDAFRMAGPATLPTPEKSKSLKR